MEYKKLLKSSTFCTAPWMEAHVAVDGSIMPCCIYDQFNPFGNIKEMSVEEAFNSERAIKARKDLVNGVKHDGCYRCWREEDGLSEESYRQIHNREYGEISEVSFNNMDKEYKLPILTLKRLDLRFDNKCNLKCRICSTHYSTAWIPDDKRLRAEYDISGMELHAEPNHEFSVSIDQENYEKLLLSLDTVNNLFFAGGEPLIQDKHYEILEYCINNNLAKNIDLVYNTNFSKLKYKKWDVLELWKHFNQVACGTSLDDFKERGEYQRTNIKWDDVIANRKRLEDYPNVQFTLSPTISIYNVFSIPDFAEEWIELGYLKTDELNGLHCNLLFYPQILNICNLPNEYKNRIRGKYNTFMNKNFGKEHYDQIFPELKKVLRALDQPRTMEHLIWKKNFEKYNKALDRVRKEKFKDIFTEYEDLFNM